MKVLTPGHRYALAAFEGGQEQQIQFIEKVFAPGQTNLTTLNDGTTNEEVLIMLIDRLTFLNTERMPGRENSIAITKLEEALLWLNKRTADRIERGVEGTHKE